MLIVYLFNLAGYNLLFQYLGYKSDKNIIARIENAGYGEKNLIEIKVPLNLPYFTDWNEYESYQGRIEIKGVHYNFVKRKYSSDTMYLLCLPNTAKTQLQVQGNEYAKKVNDIPQGKNSGSNVVKKANTLVENCLAIPLITFRAPVQISQQLSLQVEEYYGLQLCKGNWRPPENA